MEDTSPEPVDTIRRLLNEGATYKDIASELGISRASVGRIIQKHNIQKRTQVTPVDDDTLLQAVQRIRDQFPSMGYSMMLSSLRQEGYTVTRKRVRQLLLLVDPQGVYQRSHRIHKTTRIPYSVPFTHYLWHLDSNLKLGPWGFVIRGGIDGFSRTVVYLTIGDDNRAQSTFSSFLKGVNEYTIPLRTRTDKGRENVHVAQFMVEIRGTEGRPHLTGSSVRNQRIERFWRDLRVKVLNKYRTIFQNMEQEDILQLQSVRDIVCLHQVYMPMIANDLETFRVYHNNHQIRTMGHKTPNQLRRSNPMPAEHVISLPMTSPPQLHADEESMEHDEEGKEFNSTRVPPHIQELASIGLGQLQLDPDADAKDLYLRLRAGIVEAHEQICGCTLLHD